MKNNYGFLLALFLSLAGFHAAAAEPVSSKQPPNMRPAAMKRLDDNITVFRKYGGRYHFEDLMLAALAYQESGLNPQAHSRYYIGMMQISPEAARNVGIIDPQPVDDNVHAAAKYMDMLLARFCGDAHFNDKNRFLFGIASYNAGGRTIAALRHRARDKGYNPDLWFDNVERVASRHSVEYVRSVYNYYAAYKLDRAEKSIRKEELRDRRNRRSKQSE
jgi:membrane-bound lytic murein transglycosylase MltF